MGVIDDNSEINNLPFNIMVTLEIFIPVLLAHFY